ncbi:aminotransferase class V-fold PLP-dependent enzyme [Mucilaginibacter sp. RS28]|uniref:Aminotransferase class V-fold PLP-dependent enzyme n=1 Tax=Mucilaginibacter straminoryzae TaxID=2932774 RepID=A0A9X1X0E6_9SPHI|nr:aminotransferase class V-fold PLP-dependent enzyme [Mucilaginibacter straminoryzae]MCJ8208496.1 aminotransferase class V-fold PLP-dependent enzyme [Mucilaginibacter straminoryzae]
MKRRNLIKGLGILPFSGSLLSKAASLNKSAEPPVTPKRDFFKELGVTPVINAGVTMTFLSGSLMAPETLEAINSTSHDFANMYELQDKVGAKIAEMLHVEAAMVTSGAACAMLLGTAACITGTDAEKIKMLPNLPGPRPEVIMQKTHRYLFDQAVSTTGAKIIEVTGPAEMEQAINKNTVMALFFNAAGSSSITHEDFVRIAKKHNIPTFLDAAADVPPVENLFKFQKIGFDLVTFSGGKMIHGPQSAGLLFGRKDLITAARLNHSPHEAPIGRPMKVNKEEMFGMYAALKAYLERDHKKEWEDWLQRAKRIGTKLETVSTVKTKTVVDPGPANAFPSLFVDWDESKVKIKAEEVLKQLKDGTPSIVANRREGTLVVGVVLLRPDQIDVVANRVKTILQKAATA